MRREDSHTLRTSERAQRVVQLRACRCGEWRGWLRERGRSFVLGINGKGLRRPPVLSYPFRRRQILAMIFQQLLQATAEPTVAATASPPPRSRRVVEERGRAFLKEAQWCLCGRRRSKRSHPRQQPGGEATLDAAVSKAKTLTPGPDTIREA
ncbi:hypothetical protein M011DRAFT_20537 [Sporormia fimetaria CBS 119925]|uniref:Uncharacterized protein n=1 Tax=Sporormia fimetaria CBS 119925 TaxID=1340428 RepID=A0A6A6VR71_9PLEO|nr:hypothetical protein M011DRAFT_20537 [Sporormia fimetaria CBS 119925]